MMEHQFFIWNRPIDTQPFELEVLGARHIHEPNLCFTKEDQTKLNRYKPKPTPHQTVVSGSPNRWDRWCICIYIYISPKIGRKNTTFIENHWPQTCTLCFFTMDLAFGSFHYFGRFGFLDRTNPFFPPYFSQAKKTSPKTKFSRVETRKNIHKSNKREQCYSVLFMLTILMFLMCVVLFVFFALMHLFRAVFWKSKPLQLLWLSLAIHLPCEQ